MSEEELRDYLGRSDWALLKRVRNWTMTQDGESVTITCQARDGETYRVRLGCGAVPAQPPRAAFVDETGSTKNGRAWPRGKGAFHEIVKPPPHSFFCTAATQEGLEHHPNWTNHPAANIARRSPLEAMNVVQSLLDGPDYEGRGP